MTDEIKTTYGSKPALDMVTANGKCTECQFENGDHSQSCSFYIEKLSPSKNETVDKPVETVHETNPNGANQYLLDPRAKLCWEYYANPKSESFGSARGSAIRAGYSEDYAEHITTAEWFTVKLRRLNLLSKAEKVLEECLNMPTEIAEVPINSRRKNYIEDDDEEEDEEPELYVKTDPALVKIKQDTAKFVAERQGKDEGWNRRDEITGKDGKDLIPVDPKAKAQGNKAIEEFLNGGNNPLIPEKSGDPVTLTNDNVPAFIKRATETPGTKLRL